MNYEIDAKGKRLGRLASEIAQILQGKKSVDYEPRLEGKDRVMVKNAGKIVFTGDKLQQKIYYHHTGYMGHLKRRTLAMTFAQSPEKVLYNAVSHMLPKNWLRQRRLNRLKIEK